MTAIEDTKTDAAVVAQIADENAEAQRVAIATGEVYLVSDGDGGLRTIDTDDYAATPRHTAASRVVTDAASFAKYVNRHCTAGTEVFAHTNTASVVAVIDSHEGSVVTPAGRSTASRSSSSTRSRGPRGRPWTASGSTRRSSRSSWRTATPRSSSRRGADDRHRHVVRGEEGRRLQGRIPRRVGRGPAAVRGDGQGEGRPEGRAGDPQEDPARAPPVRRRPVYSIWANFRYRITANGLRLGFILERPENILDAAFADVVTDIRDGRAANEKDSRSAHDGIGNVPLFYGKPQS